jgi:hypothetical protein
MLSIETAQKWLAEAQADSRLAPIMEEVEARYDVRLRRINNEAQASAKWVPSILPAPTGERAIRSSRRASAMPASEIGRSRLWMRNLAKS